MHISKVLAFLFAPLLLVSSSPLKSRSAYAIKETHLLPRNWKRSGPAPHEHVIKLQIGLKQSNLEELERHINQISDPFHSRYGQFLSAEEVRNLATPSTETFELVHGWLREHGIEKEILEYTPAKDWITVSLPVNVVEVLLGTEYSVFEHENGQQAVRTLEWSLPQYLHDHIKTVQPTNSFFGIERRQFKRSKIVESSVELDESLHKRGAIPKACNAKYYDAGVPRHMTTLECLREFYGTKSYVPQATDRNTMGAVNYVEEDTRRADVQQFMAYYRKDANAAATAKNFTITLVNGAKNDQSCGEYDCNIYGSNQKAATDAEMMLGIAYPTKFTSYKVDGIPPFNSDFDNDENVNEPFLDWTNYVLAQDKIPVTISQSWSDEEQTVPLSYAKSVCDQLAQITARGVTLLFESGNFGVGPDGWCESTLHGSSYPQRFLPRFPASCPWVTAIGALQGFSPEKVAYDPDDLFGEHRFSSGAGYSEYFAQPSWQASAVNNYTNNVLSKLDYTNGMFNKQGRAYPDVSAQGMNIATAWDGASISIVLGTDASTPIFAGIVALINDALLAAGRPALGFMNPFLYAVGGQGGFNDIIKGSTMGCNTKGFPATPGWDAASGWGSPRFTQLKDLALQFHGKKKNPPA